MVDDHRSLLLGKVSDHVPTVAIDKRRADQCKWNGCPVTKGEEKAKGKDRYFGRGFCGKHYQRLRKVHKEMLRDAPELTSADIWKMVDENAFAFPSEAPGEEKSREGGLADLRLLAEDKFQRDLIAQLRKQGHGVWHLSPSGKVGGGAPDLLVITAEGKVLLRELKREGGAPAPHQALFLIKVAQRNHPVSVGIWQPSDLENGTIDKEIEG